MSAYTATAHPDPTGDPDQGCRRWVIEVQREGKVLGEARVYAERKALDDWAVWPAAPGHEWLSPSLYAAVVDSLHSDEPEGLSMARVLELAQEEIPTW